MVLKFLVLGNTEIRTDLINTLIDGKNVMYVDKVSGVFQMYGNTCITTTTAKRIFTAEPCHLQGLCLFGSVQDNIIIITLCEARMNNCQFKIVL